MLELSIALKYLIPRRRQISVALIAMLSLCVISLVVWLLIVFLSVTEGMEKAWLQKLTNLSAPIRITPKETYFSSYYYRIDSLSEASHFSVKTISEKLASIASDPYNPEEDPELPPYFPHPHLDAQGKLIDPVKGLHKILQDEAAKRPGLVFQDYEMSGAMLKIQMLRKGATHFLTQVSYLATPPTHPHLLSKVLVPPSAEDIHHLFFLAGYHIENSLSDEAPSSFLASKELFQKNLQYLLDRIDIHRVKCLFLPIALLSDATSYTVWADLSTGSEPTWILAESMPPGKSYEKATLYKLDSHSYVLYKGRKFFLQDGTYIGMNSPLFAAHIDRKQTYRAQGLYDLSIHIQGSIQGIPIKGVVPWSSIHIEDFSLKAEGIDSAPWAYHLSEEEMALPELGEEIGILLPKGFHDHGVLLGDKGFISYASSTASAMQELRTPVFVAGFYDPGIFSVGNKCLLVPKRLTKTINASNTTMQFDKIATNGFQIWFDRLSSTKSIKKDIEERLAKAGLSSYWEVTPFYEYDFAKELLQQFQSDRYLFSMIGIIILIVACSNIVSFLVLLVNDKKKEIAILQSLGASRLSLLVIFGTCGLVIGLIGAGLGIVASICTLHNIDLIAKLLSSLQGHDAFLQSFYGTSLPSALSFTAVWLILLATPILSLLAAMIPAWKASKLQPSTLLRT